MASLFFGNPANYSYYAIPAMWLSNMSCHWWAAGLSFTSNDLPKFDNRSPRAFLDRVKSLEKQSPTVREYIRAEAAQQNGFESIGLFAAAITAGNAAGLPAATMNKLSAAYILSRIIYNFLYIKLESAGIIFAIFIKSSAALNATLKI